MKHLSWMILFATILLLDLLAVCLQGMESSLGTAENPMTVSGLLDNGIMEKSYVVKGTVSEVLEDHVSEAGYTYSQFMIGDGKGEIRFFCSQKYGNAEVEEGDVVMVEGSFRNFYGEPELYGFCSEMKVFGAL